MNTLSRMSSRLAGLPAFSTFSVNEKDLPKLEAAAGEAKFALHMKGLLAAQIFVYADKVVAVPLKPYDSKAVTVAPIKDLSVSIMAQAH